MRGCPTQTASDGLQGVHLAPRHICRVRSIEVTPTLKLSTAREATTRCTLGIFYRKGPVVPVCPQQTYSDMLGVSHCQHSNQL